MHDVSAPKLPLALPLGQPAHIRGARKLSHVITPTNGVDFLITAAVLPHCCTIGAWQYTSRGGRQVFLAVVTEIQ